MGARKQRKKSGWFRPTSNSAPSSPTLVTLEGHKRKPEELDANVTLTASSRHPESGKQAAMSLSWGTGRWLPLLRAL